MPVNMLKKKKNGEFAYKAECQGLTLVGSQCDGDVVLCEKRALSFGYPFTTHADLCEKHANELGFSR